MWGNPPPPQKDNRGKTLFNLQKLILKIGFIIYHLLLIIVFPPLQELCTTTNFR